MSILCSGLHGDVYQESDGKIQKIIFSKEKTTNEIQCLINFKGMYGIPKLYATKHYISTSFKGKNSEGVYCPIKNKFIMKGPAIGIIMDNVGDLTLDDFKILTNCQFQKVMFNAFYIIYTIYRKFHMVHGDLHRRNIVLKKAERYSKTYYIEGKKYRINDQYYKVSVIDFDSCRPVENEVEDVIYLCSFFKDKFILKDTFISFFESNFKIFEIT